MLQVCRAILENEDKIDTDDESKRVEFQNSLAATGIAGAVMKLLASPNDNIVREALAFLVALLEDGNAAAQESFMTLFQSTREETFFSDVSTRIRDSMEFIVEVIRIWMSCCQI